ncbi:MAG TPA: diacylglycerol kinase family protein [Phycisphaerae bacterium]|nr:diacylglycerol kinase family protein [Phycisphaerae bacterium]
MLGRCGLWLGGFVRSRGRSLACAGSGLRFMVRSQGNARCHAAATAGAVVLGAMAQLSAAQWCWIIGAIGAVWCAEAMNTALELLCDYACVPPARHELIRHAKDVAAGAVLCAALTSASVGACVLGPAVIGLCRRVL